MSKTTITRAYQKQQIELLSTKKIYAHSALSELKEKINNSNENIRVLYNLLEAEINKHNGQVERKINAFRNIPTYD